MLKPLQDHVVIQPIVQEEKTSSGIYLPDTAHKDKPQTGRVIAIGSGKLMDNGTRVASELNVGDEVVFAKYVGSEVSLDGVDYIIMKETDVLAVLEAKAPAKAPVKAVAKPAATKASAKKRK